MEKNPFPDLKISNSDFLDEIESRRVCAKCSKSRKYYCYTCYRPVIGTEDLIPKIQLPLLIDIIKHPSESDGKSTAAHAAVLAPDHVSIYTYPCIPNYNRYEVVIIFPGENSQTLEELLQEYQKNLSENWCNRVTERLAKQGCQENGCSEQKATDMTETGHKRKAGLDVEPGFSVMKKKARLLKPPFKKAVFIDCTWNQTRKIYKDERLKGLQCVELKTRTTKFWRHQRDKSPTYLSTIEAIYYFVCDYQNYFVSEQYNGEYDDLLFFFSFMYHKIRNLYDGGKHLKAYQKRIAEASTV